MKENYNVTGMTCSACSSHVEKSVSGLTGVNHVNVNLLTNSMQVEYDEGVLDSAAIINAVEGSGYGASRQTTAKGKTERDPVSDQKKQIHSMKVRLTVSVGFWVVLMYVAMGHMFYDMLQIPVPAWEMNLLHGEKNSVVFAFLQFLLLLPIMYVNRTYFTRGFKTLWKRSPNMDSLIAIGSGAAVLYGVIAIFQIGYGLGHGQMELVTQFHGDLYFESAGTILTLITIGKYLESISKGKTSEAINKLLDLTPKKVTVIRSGIESEIDVSDLLSGDEFLIRPGEAVAADGQILEGSSNFDEAAITGESLPVYKSEGDKITAATINRTGLIRARAEKVGEDTTIAQIIHLVEEASSSKAPIARMADIIAGYFVPVVILISLISGAVWLILGAGFSFALSITIAVLVISCPCALGLATPVAIMTGTGRGARLGILIRSGESLETAHKIDTVVLDKTGTITEGKPVVTDIISLHLGQTQDELLQIAASLEKGSEHPLAEAVTEALKNKGREVLPVSQFEALPGQGIRGFIQGMLHFAGNVSLMEEKGIKITDSTHQLIRSLAAEGKTPLLFSTEKELSGIIAVSDVVKASSREAVSVLKKMGLHVVMLTGDNPITAEAVRKQVDIDEVIAEVLPAQKEEKIRTLQEAGHKVAMVGDGINDAPALARADVGIAIGAGTDVAIESADIILVKNSLLDVSSAIRLSRAVIRNIKQNLFWAFFYNVIGIPLAAGILYPVFGLRLSPMFAAAAMSFSSVCVVVNALRLRHVSLGKGKNNTDLIQTNAQTYIIEEKDSTKESEKEGTKMKEVKLMIDGMTCGHCTARVEKALSGVEGVSGVEVSLEAKCATVQASENTNEEILSAAVTDAGYDVVSVS